MADFNNLPDEILLLIVEQLRRLVTKQKLAALLRVSKLLYRLVLPEFYRQVDLEKNRNVLKFCTRVILDKSKASLVKSLRIDCRVYHTDSGNEEGTEAQEDSTDSAKAAERMKVKVEDVFRNDKELNDKWQEGINLRKADFVVPLMLMHLSELRSLRIMAIYDDTWDNISTIWTSLMNDSNAKEKPFSTLKNVHIDGKYLLRKEAMDGLLNCYLGEGDKYPDYTDPIGIAARWPSVEYIRAATAGDEDPIDEPLSNMFSDLSPRSSNFSHIELFPNCKLRAENICLLLNATPNLRKFKYHVGHAWAWVPLKSVDIQRALSPHKDNLEELTLWIDPIEFEAANDDIDLISMSFSNFSRLKYLCAGRMFLFGTGDQPVPGLQLVRNLPSSLETLRIVDYYDYRNADCIREAVHQVLIHKDKFPVLKKLELGYEGRRDPPSNNSSGKELPVFETLLPLAKERGIDMTLVDCLKNEDAYFSTISGEDAFLIENAEQ